ncbi:hypothetical protein AGOR_G00152390 [Albula goreensis]|uniref:C2H2-type domain-containing protein n=1 Tax=Albula goreensis TaxID=1534307 RepID=A0A8T3D3X6_9TELE|nr:hypothetical protein AGOR_G00152390 [Albula goreensis]
MEPGQTLVGGAPLCLSPDGVDEIMALEIAEVSADMVVLRLKEEASEGHVGDEGRVEGVDGQHGHRFTWNVLQREGCNSFWEAPRPTPLQAPAIMDHSDEYYGVMVNGTAEQVYTEYTPPEPCFGNLEVQFYPCDDCEASFTDEKELEGHVAECHSRDTARATEQRGKMELRPLQCMVCGKVFKKPGSLQKHEQSHSWRPSPSQQQPVKSVSQTHCPECDRTFKCHKVLDRHLQVYHGKRPVVLGRRARPSSQRNRDDLALKCCECGRHFDTEAVFYRHQCFHLRKQLRGFKASGRSNEGGKFFHCQLCALPFSGGLEFEVHVKKTHPVQYKKATKNKTAGTKESGPEKDRNTKSTCLGNIDGGLQQSDSKAGQLPHPCPECGKSFKVRAMLERHQKVYHREAQTVLLQGPLRHRGYKCPKCEKICRTKSVLQKHKRMHRTTGPFKCSDCRRRCATAETFYRHQCFHLCKQLRGFKATGRRKAAIRFFKCQLCKLQFAKGLEFESHVRLNHPEEYRKTVRVECGGKMKRRQESTADEGSGKTASTLATDKMVQIKTEEQITEVNGSVPVLHQCLDCGRTFSKRKKLDKHRRIYHHKNPVVIHRGPGHVTIPKNMSQLRCCECDRHFDTGEAFYRHQCFHLRKQLRVFRASGRRSEEGTFFHCQLCVLRFPGGLELELHTKERHPEQHRKLTKNTSTVTLQTSAVGDKGTQTDVKSESSIRASRAAEKGLGTSKVLYQCPECGRKFKGHNMLEKHRRIYHRIQRTVPRRHHAPQKGSNPLRCCECDRQYSSEEAFYRHQCFHLRKQLRVFRASGRRSEKGTFFHCQLCVMRFPGGLELELHTKERHPEQHRKLTKNKFRGNTTKMRGYRTRKDGGKTAGALSIGKVELVNTDTVTLQTSAVQDKGTQTDVKSESSIRASRAAEKGLGTSGVLYQCPECSRKFKGHNMLEKHRRIYHRKQRAVPRKHHAPQKGLNPLRCCECNRQYSSEEAFYRHQCFHLRKQLRVFRASGRKSEEGKFFHCQLCALQFNGGLELELHVKETHPDQFIKLGKTKHGAGDEPDNTEGKVGGDSCREEGSTMEGHYICGECGKCFVKHYSLRRHQEDHAREAKLHHCTECGNSFSHLGHLTQHRCTRRCEERFGQAEELHAHQEEAQSGDASIACSQCNKVFRDMRGFWKHQQSHLNQRLFHCSLCRKAFSRQEHLRQHEVVHASKTPYTCDICEKGFTSQSSLWGHQQVHRWRGRRSRGRRRGEPTPEGPGPTEDIPGMMEDITRGSKDIPGMIKDEPKDSGDGNEDKDQVHL